MLLKKSTIALCSSGSLSSTLSLPAHVSITSSSNSPATKTSPSTSTSTSLRQRHRKRSLPSSWRGSRSYATVQNGGQNDLSKPSPERNSDTGLPAWPTSANPTPYDIFATTKSAPYSKKTFYQLVKLYHPDRHPHTSSSSTLSQATKLDRYRLVVAANTILSDPTKRRAYDLYGAGWAGTHDMSNKTFRDADRAWRQEAGSAAGNATWEDWEQWHRAHDGTSGEKQSPLYMSNGLFVGALALFVVVGSWGQATRAGNHSVHLIEMREASSQHISEEMWKRRKEKAILGREERIETFLRQREGWSHGPSDDHMPKD
ncbi:J domain-containing protein 1 [Gnomoniopsis smithogilvyi]|uniref:J domain-containing protein 1 n=1 Tax=Gnomoniopsis smithogilvyi TaxID=1191159 RepID=A0A9W8YMM9_9PEZI|nr:J domain-containing protein 1 [Gnomoniopsis smithogilvyi]